MPDLPKSDRQSLWSRIKAHPLARVGPGLITGVADDDPSGIATYSQAGAQFGLNMLWTMPLCFPLMAAVQQMCGMIGRVTGKGLAANIKTTFSPGVLRSVVALLLVANTLNIAADVAAMGEVGELVSGVNRHIMTLVFVIVTLGLQILVPYHRYVFFLKWLTLSLLAYALVLFSVHVPWGEVAMRTVWPRFKLDASAAAVIVGIFGTTISPYLFFWQASEEVEDMYRSGGTALVDADPAIGKVEVRRIKWDTWSGMFYSDIHHLGHRRHAARCRDHRHQHRSRSRVSASAFGGNVRVCAVHDRHDGRRADWGPGAGRFSGLRCGGSHGLERRA
jgi:Mn2+/Fe2+ NRAMP family transporter